MIQAEILAMRKRHFYAERDTLQYWPPRQHPNEECQEVSRIKTTGDPFSNGPVASQDGTDSSYEAKPMFELKDDLFFLSL
jgi:hypothetical protein